MSKNNIEFGFCTKKLESVYPLLHVYLMLYKDHQYYAVSKMTCSKEKMTDTQTSIGLFSVNTTTKTLLVEDQDINEDNFNWTLNYDFFFDTEEQPIVELALKCVFYAIAIFIALVGNLTIIVVILKTKSLRTKFNIYVVNLAIADFFMPAFSMWLHLGSSFSQNWMFGKALCKAHTFIQVSFVCASITTLAILTLDRHWSTFQSKYLKITQKYQFLIISMIWVSSLGIAAPWIIYTVYSEFDWIGGHEIICIADFPSEDSRKAYYAIFAAICYMFPLVLMFSVVIGTIIKSNNRTSNISNDKSIEYQHHEMQRRALYLVLTILVAFCICWTPQQSLLLWDVFRDRTKKPQDVLALHYIALYMAYSTSAVNPIIYFIYNKYFREAFYHGCKIRRCRNKDTSASSTPSEGSDRRSDSIEITVISHSKPVSDAEVAGPSHETRSTTGSWTQGDDSLSSITSSDTNDT